MILFAEFGFNTVFFTDPTYRKIRPEGVVLMAVFLEVVYEIEERENVSASTASDNNQCFVSIHCGKNLGLSIIKMFHNSTQICSISLSQHLLSMPISLISQFQLPFHSKKRRNHSKIGRVSAMIFWAGWIYPARCSEYILQKFLRGQKSCRI